MYAHVKAVFGLLTVLVAVGSQAKEIAVTSSATVRVVETVGWSAGDSAREGAAELVVLLEIARIKQAGDQGGLVAIGDRRGLFSVRAEEALHHAVLQGVPVVKLASKGQVLPAPHGLFLDGGNLSGEEASQVLTRCLKRYGALPRNGSSTAELRAQLQVFQREFTMTAGTRLVSR